MPDGGRILAARQAGGRFEGPREELIENLVIAGWTGRDRAAMEEHIEELAAIGVPRPKTTPIFYRVAASLLTNASRIQVSGGHSSGEAEAVLLHLDDGLWVGVGSDHTDRQAETHGITLSKQLCAKPVSSALWRFDEVAGHWDRLILRSYATEGGKVALYQEGSVAGLQPPQRLVELYAGSGGLPKRSALFLGTMPVKGGVRPAEVFQVELEDPVLGRKLEHRYAIETLPVEG